MGNKDYTAYLLGEFWSTVASKLDIENRQKSARELIKIFEKITKEECEIPTLVEDSGLKYDAAKKESYFLDADGSRHYR